MKTADGGEILYYNGDLVKVTWTSRGKTIGMKSINQYEICPQCKKRLEKKTYVVLEDCLNFQNGAESVKTIKIK